MSIATTLNDQAADEARESDAMEARIEAHLAAQIAVKVNVWKSKDRGLTHYTVNLAAAPRVDVHDKVWTHPRGWSVGCYVPRRSRWAVTEIIGTPILDGRTLWTAYGHRVRISDGTSFGRTRPLPGLLRNVESVA